MKYTCAILIIFLLSCSINKINVVQDAAIPSDVLNPIETIMGNIRNSIVKKDTKYIYDIAHEDLKSKLSILDSVFAMFSFDYKTEILHRYYITGAFINKQFVVKGNNFLYEFVPVGWE